ncbi:phage holin, lambda family [Vibrio aerogenes]|nr:phage holin, lambda family [Vibrio aerogenes]
MNSSLDISRILDILNTLDIKGHIGLIKAFFKSDSVFLSLSASFFLASLRIIYSGGNLSDIILEGTMCSCLTLISLSVIELTGISNQFTVSIGGFIGFMGVKKISSWINRFISKKIS